MRHLPSTEGKLAASSHSSRPAPFVPSHVDGSTLMLFPPLEPPKTVGEPSPHLPTSPSPANAPPPSKPWRLQRPVRQPPKDLQPRSRDEEEHDRCAGDGAGKTLIAVMLMKEFGKRLTVDGKKMMIIFWLKHSILYMKLHRTIQSWMKWNTVDHKGLVSGALIAGCA
ncbi:hypothetical protein MUK42_34361 [Musa troglodytarum]|uniref:Uncharacterized protein n=1 Tax=Musa troglodytarum TaxID=320322 RepID=A0A9E7K4S6_9LILI|nr:hypothetical protein MUK42_34361 [Musa troglodytarum]